MDDRVPRSLQRILLGRERLGFTEWARCSVRMEGQRKQGGAQRVKARQQGQEGVDTEFGLYSTLRLIL